MLLFLKDEVSNVSFPQSFEKMVTKEFYTNGSMNSVKTAKNELFYSNLADHL